MSNYASLLDRSQNTSKFLQDLYGIKDLKKALDRPMCLRTMPEGWVKEQYPKAFSRNFNGALRKPFQSLEWGMVKQDPSKLIQALDFENTYDGLNSIVSFMPNSGTTWVVPGTNKEGMIVSGQHKSDITFLYCAVGDIDRKFAFSVVELQEMGFMVVQTSKGGFHVYAPLVAPLVANPENFHRLSQINLGIAENLRTQDNHPGNLAMVYRLPGLYNHKNPAEPFLVTYHPQEPVKRWTLEELEARFPYSRTSMFTHRGNGEKILLSRDMDQETKILLAKAWMRDQTLGDGGSHDGQFRLAGRCAVLFDLEAEEVAELAMDPEVFSWGSRKNRESEHNLNNWTRCAHNGIQWAIDSGWQFGEGLLTRSEKIQLFKEQNCVADQVALQGWVEGGELEMATWSDPVQEFVLAPSLEAPEAPVLDLETRIKGRNIQLDEIETPYGTYRFTQSGLQLGWIDGRKRDAPPLWIPLSGPFTVDTRLEDVDTGDFSLQVTPRNIPGRKPAVLSLKDLTENTVRAYFQGQSLSPNLSKIKDLHQFLVSFQAPVTQLMYTRPGWYGGEFITPVCHYGPQGALETQGTVFNPTVDYKMSTRGDLQGWQEEVATLAIGNHLPTWGIGIALANIILPFTPSEGITWHCHGTGGTGKSTMGKTGSSVMGSWADYKEDWDSTQASIPRLLYTHSNNFMFFDELKQHQGEKAGDVIYMVANGKSKAKASEGDLGVADQMTWKIMIISTGEFSLEQVVQGPRMGNRTAITTGHEARCINLPSVGDYQNLHGYQDSYDLGVALSEVSLNHYGTAGPEFASRVARMTPKGKRDLNKWVEVWTDGKLAGTHDPSKNKRLVSRFGVVAWALVKAQEWGILPHSEQDIQDTIEWTFQHWLTSNGKISAKSPTHKAIHAILEDHSKYQAQYPNPLTIISGEHKGLVRGYLVDVSDLMEDEDPKEGDLNGAMMPTPAPSQETIERASRANRMLGQYKGKELVFLTDSSLREVLGSASLDLTASLNNLAEAGVLLRDFLGKRKDKGFKSAVPHIRGSATYCFDVTGMRDWHDSN